MKCPDCGAEIGRFQAATDPVGSTDAGERFPEFNSVKCLRTGRSILLETGPEIPKQPSRRQWKKKSALRKSEDGMIAEPRKKKAVRHIGADERELVYT